MVYSHNVRLKKKYGQHFLRDHAVVDHMLSAVKIDSTTSIFEIGCGDCFLTDTLANSPCARLWVFEIDPEWSLYAEKRLSAHKKVTIFSEDFLRTDYALFKEHAPWTILSNLPYQITFPLLHIFKNMGDTLKEGVIMIQEEVAQKLVATSGRSYGFISLYFQHYFEMRLLTKIPPASFYPPPKIFSRLISIKPKKPIFIDDKEDLFWSFIKLCFKQPRRTLSNNLRMTHYPLERISSEILAQRAQQLSFEQLLLLWRTLIA